MEHRHSWHEASALRDYLRVLRRRKWVIIQALLLLPGFSVVLALHHARVYEASATVLISRQSVNAQLNNTQDPALQGSPERLLATQATLARVRTVAGRTLAAAHVKGRPGDLLRSSSVAIEGDTDLLVFKVQNHEPSLAARLATTYAKEFTTYRRQLDTAALERARRDVEAKLKELEAASGQKSALYNKLLEREQQLRTAVALQTSNSFVVEAADGAVQVEPRPVRNGILGVGLGLILGIGLAFLWEALDTRVRSSEEIAQRLGLPLLGRLPAPPRRLRSEDRLVMIDEPGGIEAEAFRVLRTNLEFATLDRGARTIMVTSAMQGEGKSTTAANLAVALARSGRHVALVDLDLRRPYLDHFFDLDGRPGMTEVALKHGDVSEASLPVAFAETGAATDGWRGSTSSNAGGVLEVIGSGPLPPDPGEFVSTHALTGLLAEVADRADVVLVDSPPLLGLGDAIALSAKVDALLLVTRMNIVRRPILNELKRVLESCPAVTLGFVVTGAEAEESYGYGYRYGYRYASYQNEKERETVA